MDYIKLYIDFLKNNLKLKKPIKVVFDCSNGTTGLVLQQLFETYKLKRSVTYKLINYRPDGNFPAHGPNPLKEGALDQLKQEVKKRKADLGVAFDADGDRVFFINEKGQDILADEIVVLMGGQYKKIVIPPNIGYLPRSYFKKNKIKFYESRIGHFFIKKTMRKYKADFGAETSGHYYFKKFFYADSGILSAILVINAVGQIEQPLSHWQDKNLKYYKSPEINFSAKDKVKVLAGVEKFYKVQAHKISKLDGLKMEFKDWWLLIRPSNTEDLIRVSLEVKDKKNYQLRLNEIQNLMRRFY